MARALQQGLGIAALLALASRDPEGFNAGVGNFLQERQRLDEQGYRRSRQEQDDAQRQDERVYQRGRDQKADIRQAEIDRQNADWHTEQKERWAIQDREIAKRNQDITTDRDEATKQRNISSLERNLSTMLRTTGPNSPAFQEMAQELFRLRGMPIPQATMTNADAQAAGYQAMPDVFAGATGGNPAMAGIGMAAQLAERQSKLPTPLLFAEAGAGSTLGVGQARQDLYGAQQTYLEGPRTDLTGAQIGATEALSNLRAAQQTFLQGPRTDLTQQKIIESQAVVQLIQEGKIGEAMARIRNLNADTAGQLIQNQWQPQLNQSLVNARNSVGDGNGPGSPYKLGGAAKTAVDAMMGFGVMPTADPTEVYGAYNRLTNQGVLGWAEKDRITGEPIPLGGMVVSGDTDAQKDANLDRLTKAVGWLNRPRPAVTNQTLQQNGLNPMPPSGPVPGGSAAPVRARGSSSGGGGSIDTHTQNLVRQLKGRGLSWNTISDKLAQAGVTQQERLQYKAIYDGAR